MNRRLAQVLVFVYPKRWRERYGEEFVQLLMEGEGGIRAVLNVSWAGMSEHTHAVSGGNMEFETNSLGRMLRRPSAFLPLAMSLTAFTMVLGYVAIYGQARETDEGAVAHLWQLLMAGQVPIILFFAARWMRRAPRQTLYVLTEQLGAALASVALVFLLGLG